MASSVMTAAVRPPSRMNNDLAGLLFNTTKRPNRNDRDRGSGSFRGGFDPTATGTSTAARGRIRSSSFGNAPSRDGTARGFRNVVEDVSIFKETSLNERVRLRFEAQGGNITNRTIFCDPNTNWSSTAQFGQTGTQCNQPRSVQLGMKLDVLTGIHK